MWCNKLQPLSQALQWPVNYGFRFFDVFIMYKLFVYKQNINDVVVLCTWSQILGLSLHLLACGVLNLTFQIGLSLSRPQRLFPSVVVFSIWGPTGTFLVCGVNSFQKLTLYGQQGHSYKLLFTFRSNFLLTSLWWTRLRRLQIGWSVVLSCINLDFILLLSFTLAYLALSRCFTTLS